MAEDIPLPKRAAKAAWTGLISAVAWILAPAYLSGLLSTYLPSAPIADLGYIYAFGAIITGLQVLGALAEGRVASVPLVSGAFVAVAFYLWYGTGGGMLAVSVSGIGVQLDFRVLAFLLVMPSLFNAARVPVSFLLERTEAGRAAAEVP